jgi:hypothetical protein
LRDTLIAASRTYEEKTAGSKKKDGDKSGGKPAEVSVVPSDIPSSFNPIIRLEWTSPEKLFFETAYVRLMPGEPITTFQRWHLVILSPQAAVLK